MVRRIHASMMILHCKLCKCAIKSIGPPNEFETAQLMELMARHLVSRHKSKAEELKLDVQALLPLLSTYLMITRFVDVPPDQTALSETIEAATQALLRIFAEETKPVG